MVQKDRMDVGRDADLEVRAAQAWEARDPVDPEGRADQADRRISKINSSKCLRLSFVAEAR